MNQVSQKKVLVIGAGLAGSEAAWFLANKGVPVLLVEGKGKSLNPAQKLKSYGELVCTNSLKSKDPDSAHGLLKGEMKALGSLIVEAAEATAVPAGDALAVDRVRFSEYITKKLKEHPLVETVDEVVEDPVAFGEANGADFTVVATGPLTARPLEEWLQKTISGDDLYFYDAIAPVVDGDSLDYSKLYFKDRHKVVEGSEEADYLNAPLNKEQYEAFINALIAAQKVPPQNFEEARFFESCLPVDLMAERGMDTARFGCMKPIGLEMPDGSRPYAAVQLRRENLLGSAYNLVGFQTRMKFKDQVEVFRMIPGLEEASFVHLGSVHRNTFLNARKVLNQDLSSREFPRLHFAGQIAGVEGYTESASMGLYVAFQIWRKIEGRDILPWPVETAMGALVNYIMTSEKPSPSNINFGLLPSVALPKPFKGKRAEKKKMKKKLASERARKVFSQFQLQESL